jgi:two-component system sensor histidine kinase UhpB
LDEVRAIARNLRPEALDDLGLAAALRQLCNEAERAGVQVERRISPEVRLAPEVELVVYRVAQEAITNVLRHAAAERLVCVLEPAGDGAELCVTDDGRGLGGAPAGSGMQGMRERALLAGATLDISTPASGGTSVSLRVP